MNKNQEKLITQVQAFIEHDQAIDENLIRENVNIFRAIIKVTDEEAEEVITDLQTKLAVRMDRGAFVVEKGHVPWYLAAKQSIDDRFWRRYSRYLSIDAKFNSYVINSIDSATDEMMDLISDPRTTNAFQRRGLVIGDVQSGKTSTYLALMNKAADAGYRVIILLTGIIEKLRRQTQARTDEGFIGLDSTAFSKNKRNINVGVGTYDSSISAVAVTSTTSDFSTNAARQFSMNLKCLNAPIVFVLKKNKHVLEQLFGWLRYCNLGNSNDQSIINLPLLLIDDEADNASVSTKPGEDPTTINKNIRKILSLFSKASYVGFTATPYANIFIDPDSDESMLGDDLFPRDFIYALEPPTNYIGATSIFPEDGQYHYMIKDNSDCDEYTPLKHKKTHKPGEIPQSLRKAIASFIITNAIRDLRGHKGKHRSMLVNVSVYVDVQKIIAEQLNNYLRDIQREIRNYYKMGEKALGFSSFSFMKDVFDTYYSHCEFSWEEIQDVLWEAVAPIVVRDVNGGNASKNLNYDEYENDGLRIIAVGGYSLSRGLTLEGLSQSYFYRNSKMYDTLMQMGRWFGYRPSYEDLCQLWINPDATEWYSYISEASDELKSQIRRMQSEQRTPADFGLCVRSDNATLLVTARNKMRTAINYTRTVCLSGNIIETPHVHMNEDILRENLKITLSLFDDILEKGFKPIQNEDYSLSNKLLFSNIPKDHVVTYLRTYQSHTANSAFHTKELVNFIESVNDDSLNKWDIVIASGKGSIPLQIAGMNIPCISRSFAVIKEIGAYRLSGESSRLGNQSYAKAGLTKEQIKKIEDGVRSEQKNLHGKTKSISSVAYFKSDFLDEPRNPLLIIYPVELKRPEGSESTADKERIEAVEKINHPLIGIAVGIPEIKGKEPKTYQYKINLIKLREIEGFDSSVEDEIDNTIED